MNTFKLRKFQRQFVRAATAPEIDNAVLSLPRGNGKSALAGYLASRILTPTDKLFRPGSESIVVAGSLEQGRIIFRFARDMLKDSPEYRFADSLTRVQITHQATRTVLQVRGSNAKNIMGLTNCPYVLGDEPGSWKVTDGELLHDAIQTAQGKPGSPLTALYIGTIAPAHVGWWPELVAGGSNGSTHVQVLQGDRETWDSWHTIRKANPLTAVDPKFRRKLLEERDAARADTRKKARFLSYRLNIPTADESQILLTVEDFKIAQARPAGLPADRPIVGIDLGGGRAWSAACAIWQSGRIEAMAVAPGIPDLHEQERRDRVPSGTYRKLVDRGVLEIAEGLRVQPPAALWQAVLERWGYPVSIICDRFRLAELQDSIQGDCFIEPRVTRWSEAASDVRSLRKGFQDGPFSLVESSAPLLAASLSVAHVKNDDQGNTRLAKRDKDNRARDDVAAALLLAAGAFDRASMQPATESLLGSGFSA